MNFQVLFCCRNYGSVVIKDPDRDARCSPRFIIFLNLPATEEILETHGLFRGNSTMSNFLARNVAIRAFNSSNTVTIILSPQSDVPPV